ncbi:MAG TPA: hypothetical protein VGN88_05505 [Phycisphaerae bacterium]|jgi:hypothetical protein
MERGPTDGTPAPNEGENKELFDIFKNVVAGGGSKDQRGASSGIKATPGTGVTEQKELMALTVSLEAVAIQIVAVYTGRREAIIPADLELYWNGGAIKGEIEHEEFAGKAI